MGTSKATMGNEMGLSNDDVVDLRDVWGRKGEAYSQDAVEYGMEIMHHGKFKSPACDLRFLSFYSTAFYP